MVRLKDKISIVTGAATGIGKTAAVTFGEEGSTVVAADINIEGAKKTVKEMEERGLKAVPVKLDLASVKDIHRFVEEVLNYFGKIDILVNNAALFSTVPILEMTEEEWDKVMDINLKGTFFLCKEVLPVMMKRKYGKIINLSSLAAKRGGVTSGVNYAASKAGLFPVTACLAKYAAPYGINVNEVVPAFCETSMFRSLPQEKIDAAIASIPLGRAARPEELARAIQWIFLRAFFEVK
jgi:3-oxoacyl-[acyl-carrier protein] reductase